MQDEATLRLAVGLLLIGAALVMIGIGILMSESAARAASGLMQRSDRPNNTPDAAQTERNR
jgi:hypothetical protein